MTLNNLTLWRQLAGFLFFLDLLLFLPWAKVIFGGAYELKSSVPHKNTWGLLSVWAVACVFLTLGILPLVSAAVLWLLFRHLYVNHRWDNLFRGGGAPGFMAHHQTLYLVISMLVMATGSVQLGRSMGLAYKVDFGLIIFCSGLYKYMAGYTRGEGMEYGCANPMWGYWPWVFRKLSPRNPIFKFQNALAVFAQIAIGASLLLSFIWHDLQYFGALLCASMFGYLIFVIRLGRLSPLMMLATLPFLPELGLSLFPSDYLWFPEVVLSQWIGATAITVLSLMLWIYAGFLVLIKATQYLNFYGNRELPAPLQKWITWTAARIPVIIWRVFTPDVTNFFIRIYAVDREGRPLRTILDEKGVYSYTSWQALRDKLRFLLVTESITLTTVFTTQRYFPTQPKLFEERLHKYADSIVRAPYEDLKFEVVWIEKGESRFEYIPVVEYVVSASPRKITENRLRKDFDLKEKARFSPIRESQGYGTYAPKLGTS